MEDKKMTEKDSLDLMYKVITGNKENINKVIGDLFIICGGLLIATLVVVIALNKWAHYTVSFEIWNMIVCFMCYFLSISMYKKRVLSKPYKDKVLIAIWKAMAPMFFILSVCYFKEDLCIPYLVYIFFLGVGTYVTGLLLENPLIGAMGLCSIALLVIISAYWGENSIRIWDFIDKTDSFVFQLLLMISAILSLIIPGFMMRNKLNKQLVTNELVEKGEE